MKTICMFLVMAALLSVPQVRCASFLDKLGLGKTSTNTTSTLTTALSQDEISNGLKAALSKGVERAISTLGKDGGFLQDASVKIPMPENLQKVERALRTVGQEKLADEFVTTMNQAAEKAVPEAAAVLGGAVQQMTVADARAMLVVFSLGPPFSLFLKMDGPKEAVLKEKPAFEAFARSIRRNQ